ncbi:MAG: type II toxin-antitoxin system RelE/ParE family toxin [Gemmataceae bacterium]
MAFQVRLTRRAEADVLATEAWLAGVGTLAVARWRTRLFRAIEALEADPHRYPAAEEAADLGVDLREALFGRRRQVYRMLFTVEAETVSVLRVRHAAQVRLAPEDL